MITWNQAVADGVNEAIMRDAVDITNHLGADATFITLRNMLFEEGHPMDEVQKTINSLIGKGILLVGPGSRGPRSILRVYIAPAA